MSPMTTVRVTRKRVLEKDWTVCGVAGWSYLRRWRGLDALQRVSRMLTSSLTRHG